jgi:rare lipoprotein A
MAALTGMRGYAALILLVGGCLAGCTATPPPVPPPPPAAAPQERASFTQIGTASWYGKAHAGRLTANGERYDMGAMTAAHRSLAFDTIVRVTNLANGRTVKVRINDRGPYAHGRILDLSAKAAAALGIATDGVARVRLEVFASDQPQS